MDNAVAYATAAKNGYAVALAHAGGVESRADAGHDPAADERHGGRVEGGVVGDALDFVDEGVGAEGADAESGIENAAVCVTHFTFGVVAVGAIVVFALQAKTAFAAGSAPVEHDVVADLDAGNGRSDLFHHPCSFMPQQKGEAVGAIGASFEAEVGVAHARGQNTDDHIAGAGIIQNKIFDGNGGGGNAGNGTASLDRHIVYSLMGRGRTRTNADE